MNIIKRKEAIEKGLKYYFTGKPCPKGYISKRHIAGWCVECNTQTQKENRENNREEYNEYFRGRYTTERRRASYFKHLEVELLDKARTRAKRKNLEFNITKDDIVVPEKCPVFDEPIIKEVFNPMAPTLDRVDNTKGYVKGNVRVISKKANIMKGSLTIDDMDKIYSYITSNIA